MKKSTFIEGHELGRYLKIRELVEKYPNDMELGGKVRELFWERDSDGIMATIVKNGKWGK